MHQLSQTLAKPLRYYGRYESQMSSLVKIAYLLHFYCVDHRKHHRSWYWSHSVGMHV